MDSAVFSHSDESTEGVRVVAAAREAELAFLIYNHSLYENVVLPAVDGRGATLEQRSAHLDNVHAAVDWLASALQRGGALAHTGRSNLDRRSAQLILTSWRAQVG